MEYERSERYEVLINPQAASGGAMRVWKHVKSIFDMRRVGYRQHILRCPGDATQITRDLTMKTSKDVHILVLGGDGTLNEVLNGIVDFKHTIVSCLKTGSGNDFARNVGVESDINKAMVQLLDHPMEAAIDFGEIRVPEKTPKRFLISAGAGYDADICYAATNSKLKRFLNLFRLGRLVYGLIGIRQIFTRKCCGATLYLDNREPIKIDGLFFVVGMNHMYEGGGVPFCPEADPTDGLMDVCLVRSMSKLKLLMAVVMVYFKKHLVFRGIDCYRCKTMRLKADKPQQLHVDGEVPYRSSEVLWISRGKLRFVK